MAIQESTPTQSRAELPAELRPIAEQLLQEARIAVEKAVAHSNAPDTYPLPARSREPALEHVLAQRLKERPASHRKRAEGRVMPSVRANAASRGKRYGELAGIDLRSTTPIAAQAAKVAGGITLSPEALMASTGANDQIAAMQSPAAAPAAAPPPVHFTSLQLRLKRIRCVEETDGAGSDELRLGGIRLEPDGGIVKIAPFQVGDDDWDTGESKTFNPHVLTSFDLTADNTITANGHTFPVKWPRTYGFTFMLAEVDNGGFPAFVAEVYKEV